MKVPIADEVADRRKTVIRHLPAGTDRRLAARDRRIAHRVKSLKGARIVWASGKTIECIVRDFSDTGASIEVHGTMLNATFELVFDDPEWSSRSCSLVWQTPARIGVRFKRVGPVRPN